MPKKKAFKIARLWKIESVARAEANAYCTQHNSEGWYVHPAVPDGPEHVLVSVCKKAKPEKAEPE